MVKLVLSRLAPVPQLLVQAWPDTAEQALRILGVDVGPGEYTESSDGLVASVGPGRWLCLETNSGWTGMLAGKLVADIASVTRLDHARTGYRLAGAPAVRLLLKGVAVDLDPSITPPKRVLATAIHGMPLTILVRGIGIFDVYSYASYTEEFEHWLEEAAAEFGVGIEADFARL